jgi:hypothetical protein
LLARRCQLSIWPPLNFGAALINMCLRAPALIGTAKPLLAPQTSAPLQFKSMLIP